MAAYEPFGTLSRKGDVESRSRITDGYRCSIEGDTDGETARK